MLSGVGAGHPERYRVTSKQRAENSNQDLTKHQVLTGLMTKNKLKMPLREERVVLHNQFHSANKVRKDARARQCSRLQIMFHFALTKECKL